MTPAEPKVKAKPARVNAAEGRRELLDIIKAAKATEERRLNPFLMDIGESLELADRFFPHWKDVQDLILDARTMNALSRVVKMQEGRLRYQAQLFHADPEAMAEKLEKFDAKTLSKVFLEAWHPIVELEQLTAQALEDALDYWDELDTVEARRRERPRRTPPAIEELSMDDLLAKGIMSRDGFGSKLAALWDDLKARGPTEYYAFIRAPTHGERIARAYAASYLVTYGYAALVQQDGALVLKPRGEREPPQASVSLPLLVT